MYCCREQLLVSVSKSNWDSDEKRRKIAYFLCFGLREFLFFGERAKLVSFCPENSDLEYQGYYDFKLLIEISPFRM